MSKRVAEGQDKDRFEKEKRDFHERVRGAYLELAEGRDNWLVLDACKKPEELYEELIQTLKTKGII